MSIVEALKKLIKNRGGNPVGFDIAEVINNFANEPAPTPSGGDVLNVTIETIAESPFNKFDKTAGEIINAYKNGTRVLIDSTNYGMSGIAEAYSELVNYYINENGTGAFTFYAGNSVYEFIFNSLDDYPHPYVD